MTSPSTIQNEPQTFEGRSVRDVVEYSPERVNEAWCRKIFRKILQSLELQYAMQMPHRAITPDTIVFHDNGDPLLAPDLAEDDAVKSEADDLTALASVVHYAITRELLPTGPLHGRGLEREGYSESLIAAVDRCMAPDPAERPQTIEQLREVLGIVPLGAAPNPKAMPDDLEPFGPPFDPVDTPAAASPVATSPVEASPVEASPVTASPIAASQIAAAPPPASPAAAPNANANTMTKTDAGTNAEPFTTRRSGLGRGQRWALVAGGAALLVVLVLVMFAEMRDSGSFDHIVLNQPASTEAAGNAQTDAPAPAQQAAAAPAAASANAAPADSAAQAAAPGAPAGDATTAAVTNAEPTDPALVQTPPPAGATAGAGAAYRLRIQPWGQIYVDGVDRGVSPPLKRLALTPGKHTVRVTNPAFQDRIIDIDTARGGGQVMIDFNDGH